MDCSLLFWLPVGHLIKNGTLVSFILMGLTGRSVVNRQDPRAAANWVGFCEINGYKPGFSSFLLVTLHSLGNSQK